jgi:hypothetical protein
MDLSFIAWLQFPNSLKKKHHSTPQRIGLEVECTGELKAIFDTVLDF